MQNTQSKWEMGMLVVAILLIVAGGVALTFATPAHATPSQISSQSMQFGTTTALATSTLSFMTTGTATTTYQIDSATTTSAQRPNFSMAQIDDVDVYILFNASTSLSILAWQYQFSNNGVDWYGEGRDMATPNISAASTTNASFLVQQNATSTLHVWAPGASGVSMTVVHAPVFPGYHERIVFSLPPGSAPGGVYAEIDTKKNPTTP